MFMHGFFRSWKTTTLGVILFLQALLLALSHLLDSDPSTNPDWQSVVTAFIAMAALFIAKDADVSGEPK